MKRRTEIPAPPPLGGGEARSQAANPSPGPGWLASLASLAGEAVDLPRHRGRQRRHFVPDDDRDAKTGRPLKPQRLHPLQQQARSSATKS